MQHWVKERLSNQKEALRGTFTNRWMESPEKGGEAADNYRTDWRGGDGASMTKTTAEGRHKSRKHKRKKLEGNSEEKKGERKGRDPGRSHLALQKKSKPWDVGRRTRRTCLKKGSPGAASSWGLL